MWSRIKIFKYHLQLRMFFFWIKCYTINSGGYSVCVFNFFSTSNVNIFTSSNKYYQQILTSSGTDCGLFEYMCKMTQIIEDRNLHLHCYNASFLQVISAQNQQLFLFLHEPDHLAASCTSFVQSILWIKVKIYFRNWNYFIVAYWLLKGHDETSEWVSRVSRPTRHSIGRLGDGLCRQNCTYPY